VGRRLHDLEIEKLETPARRRREDVEDVAKRHRSQEGQAGAEGLRAVPGARPPIAPLVFAGNATANLIRNVWAFTIIFCGHFPDGTRCSPRRRPRTRPAAATGTSGRCSAPPTSTGGKLFHIMSGNLSHQIEHHLFPDLPARRYQHVAGEVREICERYGLPYNSTRRLSAGLRSSPAAGG
jgi:NADPH-dependent stearoyl-CoA 9-desaturase